MARNGGTSISQSRMYQGNVSFPGHLGSLLTHKTSFCSPKLATPMGREKWQRDMSLVEYKVDKNP